LGKDEILNHVLCLNEYKKSRKDEFEEQYKSFYGDKIIEFGDMNEN
jgi:hypothetical protein